MSDPRRPIPPNRSADLAEGSSVPKSAASFVPAIERRQRPHPPADADPAGEAMATASSPQSVAARRSRSFTVAALGVTFAGVILAAVRPHWLTARMEAAVADAGVAAPFVFVALCAEVVTLHLSGVLLVPSPLFWPTPVAATLTFVGSLIGCVLTAAVLVRAGAAPLGRREEWPRWLGWIAGRIGRRPLRIGFVVRLVLHAGIALEAFSLLTGYTRHRYLVVTTLGLAAWITRALVGVRALAALLEVSPWLGLPLAARRPATAK